MALPPTRPRDSPTELERERLGRGDGAGGGTESIKLMLIYTMPMYSTISIGCVISLMSRGKYCRSCLILTAVRM